MVLLFDGDEAGQRAADRAFEVFFSQPVDVRVALLPGDQDPADLLKDDDGAEGFARILEGATDLLSFRFDRMASALDARGQGAGSAGRARVVEESIARLIDLGLADLPIIRRRTIVRRLARIAGVDERTIMQAIDQARSRTRRAPARDEGSATPAPSRPSDPAQHALACLLAEPGIIRKFPDLARDILDPEVYGFGHARTVAETLALYANRDGEVSLSGLLLEFEEPQTRTLATGFAAEAERITEHDQEKIEQRFLDCARRHSKERLFLRGDSATGIDRILAVREAHKRLGGNPASVPKPLV